MCNQQSQQANTLITAQNHGTILVMVAWFLACLLTLCTVARIISRCRSQRLPHLPLSDDAIVVTASICALGSIVIIATAVDSGLGKRQCLVTATDMEQIQMKIFISTILFVLAISISKCTILMYVHQFAADTLQKVAAISLGILVLLSTIAVMTGIIFQCEMPKPWEIWTGKCIPLFPFWVTATAIDIVFDIALVLLSACAVWTLRIEYCHKTSATGILSLRLLLVAASIIRLLYLHHAFSDSADPTFDFVPYAITTQCHSTLSVMLACSIMLKPIQNLLQAPRIQSLKPKSGHCKHWSDTTVGGTPYETYDTFATKSQIVKEPLTSIQASMSTPTSPTTSRNSLSNDILLPDILLPSKYTKAPPRPPPPPEAQRPDLTMFTKKTIIREPPMVTRLGSIRDKESGRAWEKVGKDRSLRVRGLA
ncbi:Nn.00g072530.m01.CDS01 [Neocucurbitaria sp. VM-36]